MCFCYLLHKKKHIQPSHEFSKLALCKWFHWTEYTWGRLLKKLMGCILIIEILLAQRQCEWVCLYRMQYINKICFQGNAMYFSGNHIFRWLYQIFWKDPTFPIHRSHTNLMLMCLLISCDSRLSFIFNLYTSKYFEVTPQLLQNGSHFKMLHVQSVRLAWTGSPNLHPGAPFTNMD